MNQSPNMKTENYIRDILFIFFAQRNLILGTTVIIFGAAIAISLLWPRTYAAYGSVLLRGKDFQKSPQALEKIDVRSFPIVREDLFSEVELLRSNDVIKRALAKLQAKGEEAGNTMSYRLRSKLHTTIVPASRVIQLSLEGGNADILVKQVDAIMEEYVQYRTEIHFPTQAMDFFADQAQVFKLQMEDIEQELLALVDTTNTPNPEAEIAKNLSLKRDLQQQLFLHRNKFIEVRAEVEYLEQLLDGGRGNHFNFISNSTLNQISTRLVDLKMERGKLARNYQNESIAVQRIDEQISKTETLLHREATFFKDDLAAQLNAVGEKIYELEARVDKITADNVALNRQALRQEELQEEAELLRESHQIFVRRREEARMNSQVDIASYSNFYVSILATAHASGAPLFPKPKVLIPLGLIAGLITGFALGFLREYFDHTFKSPRDVAQFAGMPLLFSLPVLKKPDLTDNPKDGERAPPTA